MLAALAALQTYAQRIEATLPSPDAKSLGMGGVMMTTLSGSHAIYNNSAMAVFSRMPSQISSSYYGPLRLPRARYWELRLDMAAVSPTAVRDSSTEHMQMVN